MHQLTQKADMMNISISRAVWSVEATESNKRLLTQKGEILLYAHNQLTDSMKL